MKSLCFLAFLLLSIFVSLAYGEICKWVDDEGVTHFSKYCPEDVEGDKVVVDQGPTHGQTNDTKQNAQQLYEKRSGRRDAEDAEAEVGAREARKSRAEASRRNSNCRQSGRHLGILTTQRPVFYDNRGTLHHDRESFAYNYEGSRDYVEDAERSQLIAHWTNIQTENCGK